MKKVKLIIASVAMLGLISSSTVYADGFAPGEGLYLGAFAATGMGIVQPKVTTNGGGLDSEGVLTNSGGIFEATEGGLGLMGIEGGGWIGYGAKMGDFYAGFEGEIAAGDVEFELTSNTDVTFSGTSSATGEEAAVTITKVNAKKEWTGGMFGRIGYYINPETLVALRGGVLVSKFEVSTTGSTNYSEDYYGGGPSVGVSMESTLAAIDPNLNLRIGAVYTDFLTAPISGLGTMVDRTQTNSGHDSEVTGAALSARIGLTYSFFDANSLF
jgi:hypothetical protein